MNPYHSLLTSLILNKVRQEPHSLRGLQVAVRTELTGMVNQATIESLVEKVGVWYAVLESIGLIETPSTVGPRLSCPEEKGKDEFPSIVRRLARIGAADLLRRFRGAEIEERAMEWIWNRCGVWQFPSEVLQHAFDGQLDRALSVCGPELFSRLHNWMWKRETSVTTKSTLHGLAKGGEFERVDKAYEPLVSSLHSKGNFVIAKTVVNAPYVWVWHQSLDWRRRLERTRGLKDTETRSSDDILVLNREQDRLLANVDQHVESIVRLRNAKQRLMAEEEECVWRMWERMHGDTDMSKSHSIDGRRVRWRAHTRGVHAARRALLKRMKRPHRELKALLAAGSKSNDHFKQMRSKFGPRMTLESIPEAPTVSNDELSNLSSSISFESVLQHFKVAPMSSSAARSSKTEKFGKSTMVSRTKETKTSGANAVFTPSWRRLTDADNREKDEDACADETENTSDEVYLKRHEEYLSTMKEKHRLFNDKFEMVRKEKKETSTESGQNHPRPQAKSA